MREHPIPQDVVGYRFHIIGNMTLKQFAEVAFGCVAGFFIYTTNLPAVVKWPLIATVIAMGALAAFVPFEERPLDHWIVTFFKVLYKPTKFFWRREPHIPDAFLYEPNNNTSNLAEEVDLTPYRRQRIKEYLFSVQGAPLLDQFDQAEQVRIQSIMSTFNSVRVTQVTSEKTLQKPHLKVRVRQLSAQSEVSPTPLFTVDKVVTPYQKNKIHQEAFSRAPLAPSQVAQEVEVPELELVDIQPTISDEEQALQRHAQTNQEDRAFVTIQAPLQAIEGEDVVTNADLPFPTPPTEPNKVVGMILTPHNDLVNDAIVEIQTSDGRVARAVKTNALGQFYVTTPLQNGRYTIIVEKDGFEFNPQSVDVTGNVIAPLEIRSVA
jgi:hypothetical protein